jgi:hypothetical protein
MCCGKVGATAAFSFLGYQGVDPENWAIAFKASATDPWQG